METISVSFTPFQAYLAIIFQMWLIIAPILIIRKLNYLTSLIQQQFHPEEESSS